MRLIFFFISFLSVETLNCCFCTRISRAFLSIIIIAQHNLVYRIFLEFNLGREREWRYIENIFSIAFFCCWSFAVIKDCVRLNSKREASDLLFSLLSIWTWKSLKPLFSFTCLAVCCVFIYICSFIQLHHPFVTFIFFCLKRTKKKREKNPTCLNHRINEMKI